MIALFSMSQAALAYRSDDGQVTQFGTDVSATKTVNNGDGLYIGSIIYNNPVVRGDTLDLEVFFENNFGKRLEDFEVTVIIPELNIYAKSQRQDIGGARTSRMIKLPIPTDIYPKEYDMLIIGRSNQDDSSLKNVRRVKWRPVEVI